MRAAPPRRCARRWENPHEHRRRPPRPASGAQPVDAEEARRARNRRIETIAKWVLPVAIMILTIFLWGWVVRANEIPHFILPGPDRVWDSLVNDWGILIDAAYLTGWITFLALILAVVGGAGLADPVQPVEDAGAFLLPLRGDPAGHAHRLDRAAHLHLRGFEDRGHALCAWLVAFFPVLSSTTLGLNSVDHNLRDLFRIYGATRWQRLRFLQLPSALPYFLGGLKIAGGLSLIGAVVAELVAGTGGIGSGLAFRIQEAGYRLNIARMFAALAMVAAMGVFIFAALSVLSHLLLRKWHESAVSRET
jgi:NitT/TauT family transport system permease protein